MLSTVMGMGMGMGMGDGDGFVTDLHDSAKWSSERSGLWFFSLLQLYEMVLDMSGIFAVVASHCPLFDPYQHALMNALYIRAYETENFFTQIRHQSKDEIAKYMSWIPLIGGSLGAVFGGGVSDRFVMNKGMHTFDIHVLQYS